MFPLLINSLSILLVYSCSSLWNGVVWVIDITYEKIKAFNINVTSHQERTYRENRKQKCILVAAL